MTVTTGTNKQFANGDGIVTTFYFTYRIEQAADLNVYVGGVLQASSLYTVTLVPTGYGGSVTFLTAPPFGSDNVLIAREVDYLQETHFPNLSDFNQVSLEDVVDKLAMGEQQLAEAISRAVLQNITDPTILDLTLPPPIAGEAIGWDPTATMLVNLPNILSGPPGPTGATGTAGATGATGTAGANGAYFPINSQTVSGVSFITITGFSSAYKLYELRFWDVTAASTTNLFLQVSEDGGVTWKAGSTYGWVAGFFDAFGIVNEHAESDSSITLLQDMGLLAEGTITLTDPLNTTTTKIIRSSVSNPDSGASQQMIRWQGSGRYFADTNPITALKIFGTALLSGTFTLYGIATNGASAGVGPAGPTGPAGPSGMSNLWAMGLCSSLGVGSNLFGCTTSQLATGIYRVTLSNIPAQQPIVVFNLTDSPGNTYPNDPLINVDPTNWALGHIDFYTSNNAQTAPGSHQFNFVIYSQS